MKTAPMLVPALALYSLSLTACHKHAEHEHHEQQKIVVTNPIVKDVILTQQYVCQIHSQKNIEVKALQEGYLEEILIKEGQTVKQGDTLFKVIPVLYKARMDAEAAEVKSAKLRLDQARRLNDQKPPVVSIQDVYLHEAELAKAEAKLKLAEAELNFATVKAPFDGIVDRLFKMTGSLVKKDDLLTTLSDNRVLWVYFNVPEARYYEFKALGGQNPDNPQQLVLDDSRIELILANGKKYDQSPGNTLTIEGTFNNETGNIQFRVDFPNPHLLLRHGQTGTILIHRVQKNALVIPQRATFELLDKRYVYVVGDDHKVHQRLITIQNELEDTFVIKSGLDVKDKFVLEGVREVYEDEKIEYEYRKPEDVLEDQKKRAE